MWALQLDEIVELANLQRKCNKIYCFAGEIFQLNNYLTVCEGVASPREFCL